MTRLTVFGSINLDVSLRVPRLPQTGETLRGEAVTLSPGGKGANQAHAARLMGAQVDLYGAVGDDALADAALTHLRRAGVRLDGVQRIAGSATGIATIHVGPDGDNAIVVGAGANAMARSGSMPDRAIDESGMLLLQLEVSARESMALARRFRARGRPVMLNLAPMRELSSIDHRGIDWLVLNATEARQMATALALADVGLAALPAALSDAWACSVVLTLGGDGALACVRQPGQRALTVRVPALRGQVIDTTGAGDTFCGCLAAALCDGQPAPEALAWASVAAGLSCRRSGAQTAQPDRAEVMAARHLLVNE